jgi:hypothetical protein
LRRDLRRIAEVDAQRAATAEFYLAYLRCLTIVAQSHSGTGGNRDLVGELLFLSYRLEREFVGLDAPALLQILRLRLYARLLLFLSSSSPSSFLVRPPPPSLRFALFLSSLFGVSSPLILIILINFIHIIIYCTGGRKGGHGGREGEPAAGRGAPAALLRGAHAGGARRTWAVPIRARAPR